MIQTKHSQPCWCCQLGQAVQMVLLIFIQKFYFSLMPWGAEFSGKVKVEFRKPLNMCASRAFGWLHPLPFHHPNFLGLQLVLWGLQSLLEFALHALVQLLCTLGQWFHCFWKQNVPFSPQLAHGCQNNVYSALGWVFFSAWQHPEVPVDGELWRRLQTFPFPASCPWISGLSNLQVSHLFLASGFGLICKFGSFNLCSSHYPPSLFPLLKIMKL